MVQLYRQTGRRFKMKLPRRLKRDSQWLLTRLAQSAILRRLKTVQISLVIREKTE